MVKQALQWIGVVIVLGAIGFAYYALLSQGASPFELVLTSVMVLMVIAVAALILHLRALHRALFQHAQIAYKGFVLEFFLSLKALLRERREDPSMAENDVIWNLLEDYFQREAEFYNTVVEELYDKTTMMHMLDRSRARKEAGIPDSAPVEPLYAELHDLLTKIREGRTAG